MKKLRFIILFLFVATNAYSTTVLYRVSSGEIKQISETNNTFVDPYPPPYFAVLTDPIFTDGKILVDSNGDMRVAGYAKIYDGSTVRNATQVEIDTFAPLQSSDRNEVKAQKALLYLQQNPKFRMIITAVIRGIVKEDNEQRLWIRAFMTAVADSTSLGDFQSRVAALDTPADRELSAAKTYILNQINKDD